MEIMTVGSKDRKQLASCVISDPSQALDRQPKLYLENAMKGTKYLNALDLHQVIVYDTT